MKKTGLTNKLRKLELNKFCYETGRTSEVHIFAKRLGIKVKTKSTKRGLKIERIK